MTATPFVARRAAPRSNGVVRKLRQAGDRSIWLERAKRNRVNKIAARGISKNADSVLSMHDEPTYAVRSLRAGAKRYVTKQDAWAASSLPCAKSSMAAFISALPWPVK